MKIFLMVVGAAALVVLPASATLYTYTSSAGAIAVPDGNPVGITSTINVNGLGSILSSGDNVSVVLNVSGGNIGDLYAYLRFNGTTVMLMNQPGGSNPYLGGSFTSVTLSDGNTTSVSSYGGGNVTGTSYNPSGGSSAFQAFNNMSANGNWTLFFADLSGGDGGNISTLNSWSLDITAVPEPINLALPIFSGLIAVAGVARRLKGLRKNSAR